MVLAQLCFRAWAVLPSYFYLDDYRLVDEARTAGLNLDNLTEPYDAQFMPFGRFVAWVAAIPDQMSWPLMAATSLGIQLMASVACASMLITLFGWRWRILAPLGLYLSSAMTMPAFMWWAAGLNQMPLQAVFFAALATWVSYLRTRRLSWLALTVLVLSVGLLCYVKTLLVFPVLAFVAVGWFARGSPLRRVISVLRDYRLAALTGLVGGIAFLVYYVRTAPQLATTEVPSGAVALARQMVGDSFIVALFGGPWQWDEQIAPVAQADAPQWAVYVSWALAGAVVAYFALRRERTLRAWVLLAAYVGIDYVLLLTTRAQVVGSVSGTEYRYMTDAASVAVLALGLASMSLPGATESSRLRASPLPAGALGPRWIAALTVLVVASSTWSSWAYARVWHTNHPGASFFSNTLSSVEGVARVDLANQFLPITLTGAFGPPANATEVLLPLLDPDLKFPTQTDQLHVLDEYGRVVLADLEEGTTSVPGPTPGCGWAVTGAGRRVPLKGPVIGVSWWVRLDYLSSQDTGLRLRAGRTDARLNLRRGLGTVYVLAQGPFNDIALDDLDPGVTLCVDALVVGNPVAPTTEDAP